MSQDQLSYTVLEIARHVGGTAVGDGGRRIRGMRPFLKASPDDIAFLDPKNPRILAALPECKAGCLIVDSALDLPPDRTAIRIDPPHLGLARVLQLFFPRRRPVLGISPEAHVGKGAIVAEGANIYPGAHLDEGVRIGAGTDIFPGCYVGPECAIGEGCILYPNVTVYERCEIGNRVIIHSGAVIGADGFGFIQAPSGDDPRDPVRHEKILQVGKVVIEDDVEIGANTTIDRATLDATVIGKGTKIDNLVMVAHNCTIGKHSIVVSQAGISGSTSIGNYVTIAGQAGLVGHITVGDRAVITAKAGVTKDVEEGKVVIGAPAMDIREGRLAFGLIARLPEFKKDIGDLLRRVEALEKQAGRKDS